MPGYWAYESWRLKRVRIHRGACRYCNNGKGWKHVASSEHGRWNGPYANLQAVLDLVKKYYEDWDTQACPICLGPKRRAKQDQEAPKARSRKVTYQKLDSVEIRKLKEAIAGAIVGSIGERRLARKEAAMIVGVGEAQISSVFRRRLEGLSVQRLLKFLVMLGHDIEIIASEAPRSGRGGLVFSLRPPWPSSPGTK